MSLKAKVLRLRDVSWPALTKMFEWPERNGDLNLSENYFESPLKVVQVSDEKGVVCFMPVQHVMVVSAYALRPGTPRDTEQHILELVDETIQDEAQRAGVGKISAILPATQHGEELKTVKILETRISSPDPKREVGCYEPTHATKFLN
jgi:hypothetical protein